MQISTERAAPQSFVAKSRVKRQTPGAAVFVLGLAVLWFLFYEVNLHTPYIANGSDIVKAAKKLYERDGKTFPSSIIAEKIAIFGDSKILTGFVPKQFDEQASEDHLTTYSFNSGFPGQDEFVGELSDMLAQEHRPDVVLLTREWFPVRRQTSFFSLSQDDNELASRFFPFRLLTRNVTRFLAEASRNGGPVRFYRSSQETAQAMIRARGWFFIKKLSIFPDDRLPPGYTLASDNPGVVERKHPDFASLQLDQLNSALASHHTRCFYVPYYRRIGEFAPAPSIDNEFAENLAAHSSCRVVGPNYFSYPPALFNDPIHLNPDGAKAYTADLYNLIAPHLR